MSHWAAKNERGNLFFLRITAWLVKHLSAPLLKMVSRLVVCYFYLTAPRERAAIAEYQQKLTAYTGVAMGRKRSVFAQFLQFAEAICDRFAVWQGKLTYQDIAVSDPDNLYADIQQCARADNIPRGQLLVCSHLGNVEISRALAAHNRNFVLNVLVHSKHAVAFNQVLKQAGAEDINLIQVTDLDMPLMVELEQRITRGEWLAIAGDRVPVRGEKTVEVQFLGHSARFPQGPWLLAGLLKMPVNLLFCHKIAGQYQLHLSRLADQIDWSRPQREQSVRHWAQAFADQLAKRCADVPLQWFNFYSFWQKDSK